MKHLLGATALVCLLAVPAIATAQSVTLTPANPQPSAGSLAAGLAVAYSFPIDVQSLRDARRAIELKSVPGKPLAGLSYDDTKEGDPTLTSGKAMRVVADISGYIKFDAAGTYTLDFLNNDGFQISIGGQEVGLYDKIHACGYAGEIDVNVPVAGYYPVEAVYFQRKGTACLMMEWGADSDSLDYVPDSAFFHKR